MRLRIILTFVKFLVKQTDKYAAMRDKSAGDRKKHMHRNFEMRFVIQIQEVLKAHPSCK